MTKLCIQKIYLFFILKLIQKYTFHRKTILTSKRYFHCYNGSDKFISPLRLLNIKCLVVWKQFSHACFLTFFSLSFKVKKYAISFRAYHVTKKKWKWKSRTFFLYNRKIWHKHDIQHQKYFYAYYIETWKTMKWNEMKKMFFDKLCRYTVGILYNLFNKMSRKSFQFTHLFKAHLGSWYDVIQIYSI